MKRYYLSKIKTVQDPLMGVVHRHRLQELDPPVDYVGGNIKTDANGNPVAKALLVLVGGVNHARLANDPEIVPLPNVGLDVKVNSIHTPTKLKTKADVKALGFDAAETDTVWGNADGLRDVIDHYGSKNVDGFDSNAFDLDES